MAKKGIFPPTLTRVTAFSKCIALFLLILFPFAGFYIGMNYQSIQDNKAMQIATPTPEPTAMPTTVPSNHSLSLVLADSGKTFHVSVGTGILVTLSSPGTQWTVKSSDSSILRSFQLGIAQRAGEPQTTRFTAVKKGTAQIVGEGTPSCSQGQPCPQFLMRFNANIIVE